MFETKDDTSFLTGYASTLIGGGGQRPKVPKMGLGAEIRLSVADRCAKPESTFSA